MTAPRRFPDQAFAGSPPAAGATPGAFSGVAADRGRGAGDPPGPGASGAVLPVLLPSGGFWLRVLLGAVLVPLLVSIWQPTADRTAFWLELVAAVLLWLWAVVRPDAPATTVIILAVLADRTVRGVPTIDGGLLLAVTLIPVAHTLAALAAVVPGRSSLAPAALLPSAIRLAGALLLTVLVLVAVQLTG